MPVKQLLPLLFSGLTVILTIAIPSMLTRARATVEELIARPIVASVPQLMGDGTGETYTVTVTIVNEDLRIPLDQLQFNSIKEC